MSLKLYGVPGSPYVQAARLGLTEKGIDFEMVLVPQDRKWKWRMWADHGVEFFIHPAMLAKPAVGFPEFFRQDREGLPRGVVQVVRSES